MVNEIMRLKYSAYFVEVASSSRLCIEKRTIKIPVIKEISL